LANNTESRQDNYIDFGMTEKSEKVLVQDRIASTNWIEEDSFEVTIH
jgi:hypothetical protein